MREDGQCTCQMLFGHTKNHQSQPQGYAEKSSRQKGLRTWNYGKWRVCVDFTDLNKACPKDPFPLPRIDQLVDATVGHPRTSFLDAFQGYHQIPLALDD